MHTSFCQMAMVEERALSFKLAEEESNDSISGCLHGDVLSSWHAKQASQQKV